MKKRLLILYISFLFSIGQAAGSDFSVLWRFPAAGRITAMCRSAKGDRTYFLCEDRSIYAVSSYGKVMWKSQIGGQATEEIVESADGSIYTFLKSGELLSVNPRGRVIWKLKSQGIPVGGARIGPGGTVFFATREGKLYAVSNTGNIKWTKDLGSSVKYPPEISDTGLFSVYTDDGKLTLFNRWGERQWERRVGDDFKNMAFINSTFLLVIKKSGSVVEFNFSGDISWESDFPPPVSILSYREGYNRNIYLYFNNGDLLKIGPQGKVERGPSVKYLIDGILDISADKTVTAYDSTGFLIKQYPDGSLVRYLVAKNGISTPIAAAGGVYICGGNDWILYGVRDEKKEGKVDYAPEPIRNRDFSFNSLGGPINFNQRYIEYLIDANDEEKKREALKILDSSFDASESSFKAEEAIRYLEILASQCVIDPEYTETGVINNFPQIRLKAVEVLSSRGDLLVKDFLVKLAKYEFDENVLSAEIEAVGKFRSDPEGEAGKVFRDIIEKDINKNISNRIASSVISAIIGITNYHGSMDDNSISTLLLIFQGNYSKDIRSKALQVLSGIGK